MGPIAVRELARVARSLARRTTSDYAPGAPQTKWENAENRKGGLDTGRLVEVIRENGLDAHHDAILATARPAIYVQLGAREQGSAGQSRVGGAPDLPDSIPWPVHPTRGRARSFILQINLAELPDFPENPLPRGGMLYLFVGESEDDADQLIVYRGDEPLRPRHPAPDTEFVTDWYENLVPHRLEFSLGVDVPRWGTRDFFALVRAIGQDAEEALGDLGDSLAAGAACKLLGHASGIGHDPRELAYMVRELDLSLEQDYAQRARLDPGAAARWTNLLEVRSRYAVGLFFGDAGFLQVLVHEDDLRRQDFSRVWVNFESS